MCRLVGYLGPPIPLSILVFGGTHSLLRQSWEPRELLSGCVNADGWGVAWYGEAGAEGTGAGQPPEPARLAEARPIWQDERDLRRTLPAIRSSCAIAALRNVTPGQVADRSGLLPLVHGRWAFALNGFVPEFRTQHMRALRATLPDPLYAALEGASDSETVFLLAVAALREGAGPIEALATAGRAVAERVGRATAQLNMMLTDGARLVAVRSGTALETNSLYVARGHPLAPGGTLVASEPLDRDPCWERVDGHSAVTLGPGGACTTEPFEIR